MYPGLKAPALVPWSQCYGVLLPTVVYTLGQYPLYPPAFSKRLFALYRWIFVGTVPFNKAVASVISG